MQNNPLKPLIHREPAKMDRPFLYAFLSQSYWAKGRTPEEIETMIQNSHNFGLFLEDRQIGYARVLSDRMFFAYLLDVFIDAEFRGKGYARILLDSVFSAPEFISVKVWRLGTDDAQGLYEKYGFTVSKDIGKMMERRNG
jgi:ribosomal protein S18 acetylase RimI-like enzyme